MEGSSDSPVVGTLGFHCRQGAWVRSLVRKLHLLCSAPKKKVVGLEVECMWVAQELWTEGPLKFFSGARHTWKEQGQEPTRQQSCQLPEEEAHSGWVHYNRGCNRVNKLFHSESLNATSTRIIPKSMPQAKDVT